MSLDKTITVVTGHPRSGTTLMMRMLYRGGVQIYCDNRSSFEAKVVMELPDNYYWLKDVEGKAVKILDICEHRVPLWEGYKYKFILMKRNPYEIAKSQMKFLHGLGFQYLKPNKMPRTINQDWHYMKEFIKIYDRKLLIVEFESILENPMEEAKRIEEFMGRPMDKEAMVACVMKRGPECLPEMAELGFKDDNSRED